MEIAVFGLLVAAGGGFFGAAIGGLHAFVFTGLMAIVGHAIALAGGGTGFLDDVALGPFFGPHVTFAAGVAAVAFAARRSSALVGTTAAAAVEAVDAAAASPSDGGGGAGPSGPEAGPDEQSRADDPRPNGKDIGVPLIALERPSVLLVGAGAGVLGYVVEALVAAVPWFGENTDSAALTVLLLGIATRLVFGRAPLFARTVPGGWGARGLNRFAPHDDAAWIRYHERFLPSTLLGFFVGLLGAGVTVALLGLRPELGGDAKSFVFGVSAVSLLFLSVGMSFPVTHHISIVSGAAAAAFLPVVGDPAVALLVGAVGGVVAAWLGELFARLWHNGGDTQVDPPAAAIWPATTLVLAVAAAV